MTKTFNMEIPIDLLESKLSEALKKSGESHYKVISKVIISNLTNTSIGLEQLYMAFSGHEEKINFFPGDEVIISTSKVYTWVYDQKSMIDAGLIVNNTIKAKVLAIYPYTRDSVSIEYTRIELGKEPCKYTQSVSHKYLTRNEDCKLARPDMGDLI